MVRGVYINHAPSERMTIEGALDHYEKDVTSTKKTFTSVRRRVGSKQLKKFFGKYSLAAATPDLVATYRDERLAAGKANSERGRSGLRCTKKCGGKGYVVWTTPPAIMASSSRSEWDTQPKIPPWALIMARLAR